MPSLYDISIPILTKVVRAELHLIKKGTDWATEKVAITTGHTRLAINYLTGSTFPVMEIKEAIPLEGLHEMINTPLKQLAGVTSAEKVSAEESTMVASKLGDRQCHLTVVDTLQFYTMPDVYFHITTLYDILTMKGVPLGKIEFLGPFLESALSSRNYDPRQPRKVAKENVATKLGRRWAVSNIDRHADLLRANFDGPPQFSGPRWGFGATVDFPHRGRDAYLGAIPDLYSCGDTVWIDADDGNSEILG
ncbi:hypothetical protein DL766_001955 [Monosporascus sp. MC13-8B]|uniref:Uncharacterized protein n=1 Tax=Monosporascus cannonballus TaxID=155416 RepID=A0ABY0H3G6_9PEZI|nr:hypothetical protein DL762_007421 [Monosporascus cannonballus]RYO97861.1 hypothetical protein DL763_002529 [Monosporascus cannonballus]RYP36498.1 hypothetical protein DL766_001955 [Monosporascus sp. MC13-8B]